VLTRANASLARATSSVDELLASLKMDEAHQASIQAYIVTLREGVAAGASRKEVKRGGINDFELVKRVGSGSFGDVWQATSKIDGEQYAIKMLDKNHVVETDTIDCVIEEQRLLRLVHNGEDGICPFVVQLFASFQDESRLYLVLNLVRGGDLYSMLCSRDSHKLEANEVHFIGAELVVAIECMHKHRVAFRDLKAENLMITHDGHVVVTDLGLAKHWEQGVDMHSDSIVGTPEYLPPEIIREDVHGLAVDLWGMGVLLFEMLTGRTPFSSGDAKSLFVGICEWGLCGGAATAAARSRLATAQHAHPPPPLPPLSVRAVMNDPVFPPYVDSLASEIILAFMEKEPEDRLGACGFDEVKGHPYFEGVDWDASALAARDSPVVQNVDYEQSPTACSVNIKLQRKEAAAVLAPSAAAPVAGSANPFQEFDNVQLLESAPGVAKLTAIEDGGSDGDEAEGAAATLSPAELVEKLKRRESDLMDVAEEKEALRTEMSRVIDHEHHLEHVLDLMPGKMISVKDAEEKFVVTNKRFAATYGTVPQALAGKKRADLGKHTEEADFMAEEDRVVRDTQMKVVKEFILHRSTGDADDVSNTRRGCKMKVTKIPYLDEVGGQCVLSIGEDVTNQDEHAKALRSRAEDAELRLMRLQQQHDLVRAPPATPPACRTDRLLLSHPARFCHARVICRHSLLRTRPSHRRCCTRWST